MAATIIYGEATATVANARQAGEDLWLAASDLTASTGWEIKPEGICRDEVCIPVPADKATALLKEEGAATWLNLAEFARFVGQPYAHDDEHSMWYFGAAPEELRSQLLSLEAPDFTLPDLDGKQHSLSDHRGKKVLLMLWASW